MQRPWLVRASIRREEFQMPIVFPSLASTCSVLCNSPIIPAKPCFLSQRQPHYCLEYSRLFHSLALHFCQRSFFLNHLPFQTLQLFSFPVCLAPTIHFPWQVHPIPLLNEILFLALRLFHRKSHPQATTDVTMSLMSFFTSLMISADQIHTFETWILDFSKSVETHMKKSS